MNVKRGGGELRRRAAGAADEGRDLPAYMFFTIEQLRRPDGAKLICSPPMRSEEDNTGIWQGVEDGTIQVMAMTIAVLLRRHQTDRLRRQEMHSR